VSRAVILQHLEREGPGLIAELCQQRGLAVDIRRLDRGAAVPDALADGDALIVMGGPMGIADVNDARYPFLSREIDLMRQVLSRRQPVLGVCLGSQLLAHAAGSHAYPNQRRDGNGVLRPLREVGYGEVRLLGAENEPALAGLGSRISVLHWHGDTFDLPEGAVRLAENDACVNQAFRIGRRAFGLQFHVETDAELVRAWAREDADFVMSALGPEGPADIIVASETASAKMRGPGKRLIGNILAEMMKA
jgi:GMP synthase (glutamine-hydrolysing)